MKTHDSTGSVAFSDVLNQQRRKEQLAEVRAEIALRCQVVQALKGLAPATDALAAHVRISLAKQTQRLLTLLVRECELEEQEPKP